MQEDFWICISPSLNVASCGRTLDEAKEGFVENILTFVEDLLNLEIDLRDQVLRELGWLKAKIIRKQFSKAYVSEAGILEGITNPKLLSLETAA